MSLCIAPSIALSPPPAMQIGSTLRLLLTMQMPLAAALRVSSSHSHVVAYVASSVGEGVTLVLEAVGTGSYSVMVTFQGLLKHLTFVASAFLTHVYRQMRSATRRIRARSSSEYYRPFYWTASATNPRSTRLSNVPPSYRPPFGNRIHSLLLHQRALLQLFACLLNM